MATTADGWVRKSGRGPVGRRGAGRRPRPERAVAWWREMKGTVVFMTFLKMIQWHNYQASSRGESRSKQNFGERQKENDFSPSGEEAIAGIVLEAYGFYYAVTKVAQLFVVRRNAQEGRAFVDPVTYCPIKHFCNNGVGEEVCGANRGDQE